MTIRILFFRLSLFASILISACSKGSGGSGPGPGPGGGGTPAGPLFTAVKSMMQTNCAVSGCHLGSAASAGLDFSIDNTIVTQRTRIKVRAVDEAGTANQMPQPPRPALSAADQKKITDWIAAGGTLTN